MEFFESQDKAKVIARLKARSYVDREDFDARGTDERLVNFENGVFNLDTWELEAHSPDHLFRHVIPRALDLERDPECPEIDAFLENVIDDELDRQTLYEWTGACMYPGIPLQKFLIVYGSGGNGKGVYFDILKELVGSENASVTELGAFADNGYELAELDGSLANLDSESIDKRLTHNELGPIKRLTGGDGLMVRPIYGHPFTIPAERAPSLTFSANSPPRFPTNDNSIARRLLSIEFPHEFTKEEGDGNKDWGKRAHESA